MFGRKAVELIQELGRTDPDQLTPYNSDAVHQVIEEEHEHHRHIVSLVRKLSDTGRGFQDAPKEDTTTAAMVHHYSLLRNKRCLLAYLYNRMQRIKALRWQLGAILPQGLQERLSAGEQEMFRAYSDSLAVYMSQVDEDLTVDGAPPKDPYIEVRVLEDTEPMLMEDKVTYLEPNTVHLVRRAEVEPLILQGLVEQIDS